MSDPLVFYTNPMSRGRIARWMLEETGAKYETIILEYGAKMKAPEYLAINPMGKVPAIHHGSTVVTECAAIIAYLADTFPASNLAPAPQSRGEYYRWMFYMAGPFEAAVTNQSLGFVPPTEKQGTVGFGSYEAVLDTLENVLSQKEFIAGNEFTAADVYVGSQIGFGLQFDSIEKRKPFVDYWERVSDRPAYHRASEQDNAAMAEMKP